MGQDVGTDTQALDMARYLVARMAPAELESFEETAPGIIGPAPRAVPPGELPPPGSVVVEASGMVFTAVACGVAREVLEGLAKEAGQALVGRITSWFRLRRRTPATRPTDPRTEATAQPGQTAARTLSPGVLGEVRILAQRRAELLGLPSAQAELLAESVVGYLSTTPAHAG